MDILDILKKNIGPPPNPEILRKINRVLIDSCDSIKEKKVQKRNYGLFSYISAVNKDRSINYEQALFPLMNPNIAGGIPSIFSCKPEFRVKFNPGDIIFCFPQGSKYFTKALPRRLTLIFKVLKIIEIKHALDLLTFKSVENTQRVNINGQNVFQFGDITAEYSNGIWKYAGREGGTPHKSKENIFNLNDSICPYSEYLNSNTPLSSLGCKTKFNCTHYYKYISQSSKKICYMRFRDKSSWEYDILFKWGLLGSCDESIPEEFRSHYFGSQGITFDEFWKIILKYCKIKTKNPRHVNPTCLNKYGVKILQRIQSRSDIKIGS